MQDGQDKSSGRRHREGIVMGPQAERGYYYTVELNALESVSREEILGCLVRRSEFSIEAEQRDAWWAEVEFLKRALTGLNGTLFLEFIVPRIGSRLDAVVIAGPAIFAIEFKVGETKYLTGDLNQVWDYALDLKNFHEASHDAPIVPILVATGAPSGDPGLADQYADGVFRPAKTNARGLGALIRDGLMRTNGAALDARAWAASPYRPTPTIIQAARALYSQHSVEAIARHDAGARNLALTSRRVEDLVDQARSRGHKIIVFVTGVPGAGKTLVGLNTATRRRDQASRTHATFLSGNGPLVAVLSEALTRDELARLHKQGKRALKVEVKQKVKAFIQNVHHFRDDGLRDPMPPSDHVVIFDEAQRAWNQRKTADFMLRRKQWSGFDQSEPQFLVSVLDRHEDWAAVICLVGGGQEINDGEAGIAAWLDAVRDHFPNWHVYLSPELTDSEYTARNALDSLASHPFVTYDPSLHLSVSMRSFRAEAVSHFVKAVLDCDMMEASHLLQTVLSRYPIALTRNLEVARHWVRDKARASERYGLVASSQAQRLKPHAIDVRVEIDPVIWFLNGPEDIRSSWYLEDAATEFQVQGLELDWVCVTWDADLRFRGDDWSYHQFRGSDWTKVHKPDRQLYQRNAYRVLLTRARQGMVLFVPPGDRRDPTRSPEFYDATFNYLKDIGVPVLAG